MEPPTQPPDVSSLPLLTAVPTAIVFAVFGFPFRYYRCWFSWNAWGTLFGITLYFLVAGGGGLLGWIFATLSGAHPTSSQLLNGLLYGFAGSLALRAEFGTRPQNAPEDQVYDPKSLLTKSVDWTVESLDDMIHRCAERWLRSLDDDPLILTAYQVHADVASKPPGKLSDKAKAQTQARLVELMEKLAKRPKKLERSEALAHLVDFCARYYKSEHLAKPTARKQPAVSSTQSII